MHSITNALIFDLSQGAFIFETLLYTLYQFIQIHRNQQKGNRLRIDSTPPVSQFFCNKGYL